MSDSIRPHIGRPAGSAQHRPQQRAIATRAAILRTFAIAFDATGYAATTMNEVIKANSITKGSVYFHFPSKEAIAQELIESFDNAVAQSVSDAAGTGGSIAEQLRIVFASLADRIDNDRSLRAGFKLTLDPSIDGAHTSYRRWIDTTSDLVESGIRSGSISDTVMGRRLGWNLCSGFVGAVHSVSILREDLDLSARTMDMLSSYLIGSAVDGEEL
ncbi:TetR/AcrR family transcriptional regulator [Rhodococcus erythropolis]|uniref:TetR/AcrR family transcriptional regulator n=1 Tax=Rhodococcus TaxID=1827 RepID=UPI001AE2A907|nr:MULTISPECIES: TetR/AcrR family transcriptional regulator [Rhodococcus]MBP2520952.1 AcrR family transcriptional regulator [Rhodococcus sp. PvP104]MBY6382548.1 TetR/AcrR family transcriptional regulator [Rhodococcus erythropolis]